MTTKLAVIQPMTLTAAQIDDAISNIASRGRKLDSDIQACGLSILLHIENHGDITKANKLWDAMPKGSRRNALIEWFISFGKLKVSDKDDKRKVPLVFDRKKETRLQDAMDKPWYECKPEQAPDLVFDVEAQLRTLLKRVKKAQDDGKEIKTGRIDMGKLIDMVGEAE